jgi:hypothetical protein
MPPQYYKKSSYTNLTILNSSLSYNFNNITSFNRTTSNYTTIDSIFTGYSTDMNTQPAFALKTISTQSLNSINNISYYQIDINSTIYYKLQYIHVGISPIKLYENGDKYGWCVMLDLLSSSLEKLLIIIPINYDSSLIYKNELYDFSALIYNFEPTTVILKPININKFIKSSTFEIGGSSTNRLIILRDAINTNFFNKFSTNTNTKFTNYTNNKFQIKKIYISTNDYTALNISQKPPSLIQNLLPNDIYIDCQPVNTTDKTMTDTKNENSDTSIAVFGLILSFIILYALYKLIKMITSKSKISSPSTNVNS